MRQGGHVDNDVAANLDAVAAAAKHLTKIVLTAEGTMHSNILECIVPNQKALDAARGLVEPGDGVGVPLIHVYFTEESRLLT